MWRKLFNSNSRRSVHGEAENSRQSSGISSRVATCLLVVSTGLLLSTLSLGTYIYVGQRSYDQWLLNRKQMEAELMKGNSAHAIYPHADARIGYVFNPALKTANLWAPDGGSEYRINQLGLRGREIGKKGPEGLRIVLVSDSWFWGWKLPDAERLEVQLKSMLDKHFPSNAYEVITVAMPGWNVENEAAFLEDHMDLLEPDIIVWSLASNDSWTTPGVLPPGQLASKMSRSSVWLCPETNFRSPEAPSWQVVKAWNKNIELMNDIKRTYNVPIIALFADGWKTFASMLRTINKAEFPIFVTSPDYQREKRWFVSYPNDAHPTAWATEIIATDILGSLVKHGLIPNTDLSQQEKEIIDRGALASEDVAANELEAFMHTGVAPFNRFTYPTQYSRTDDDKGDVHTGRLGSLGIWGDWNACPQGRLLIKNLAGNRKLILSFDDVKSDRHGENKLHCMASMPTGEVKVGVERRRGARRNCDIELPYSDHEELLDVIWRFDRFTCISPYDCLAARFFSLQPGGIDADPPVESGSPAVRP